jgi:predicted permease
VLSILLITFPFFVLVLCGYIAARRGMLPQASIPGLNTFVLYFALPCMLYRFGATTPIAQLLDASVIAVYLACALVMVGFTILVTRGPRIGWNDASFGALVAAFPNTGFMGVPLLVALLGAKAAGPAIVSITVDMIITSKPEDNILRFLEKKLGRTIDTSQRVEVPPKDDSISKSTLSGRVRHGQLTLNQFPFVS